MIEIFNIKKQEQSIKYNIVIDKYELKINHVFLERKNDTYLHHNVHTK